MNKVANFLHRLKNKIFLMDKNKIDILNTLCFIWKIIYCKIKIRVEG